MRIQARIGAHMAAQSTEGKYDARVVEGQGLVMGGRVDVVSTLSPAVFWIPTEGTEVKAWEGQGYSYSNKTKLRASLMAQARTKRDVLANYLKLNKRRWETVQAEERMAKELAERQERRAREHVRRLAPDLLKALKVLTLTPHIVAYLEANDPKALEQARNIATDADNAPKTDAEFRERHEARRKGAA
jgi:hypothetical protein